MDMDIDVSWCLTCSKRVQNSASPYCSYECRLQDSNGGSPSRLSPIYSTHTLSRTTTASRDTARRKPSAPTGTRPGLLIAQEHQAQVRDRRAFSFPAAAAASPRMTGEDSPPMVPLASNAMPGSSLQQLRFARRQVQYTAPHVDETTLKPKTPKRSRPSLLSSSLHGSSAPIIPIVESAICSTSEESDDEPILILPSPAKPSRAVSRPPVTSTPKDDDTNTIALTYASYLPPVRPLPARKPSTVSRSPSAFLAATSASRSREDILSWAKNVGMRPRATAEESEEDERERGRARTRRRDVFVPAPGSTTPSSSSVQGDNEAEGSGGVGTTPKGVSAIGSALSGLGFGLGFAPFTSSRIKAPASASVDEEAVIAIHQGGATPTMSTVSFSEVMETSIGTDLPDSIEIANDGESSRSGFRPTAFFSPSKPKTSSFPAQSTPTQTPAPSPLKPITSTANALWNLSAYLRSFKPFSLAGALSTASAEAEASVPPPAPASRRHSSGFMLHATGVPMPARSPVPEEDEEHDHREMVRSLPMDIIPMGPRSAAPPPAERSRSRSTNSQALLGRGGQGKGVGRQRENYSAASSFDAAAAVEEDDDRGRSRRVVDPDNIKHDVIVPVPVTPVGRLSELPADELDERGRGRRRDLDSVSRGRSGSRGRKARGRAR